MIFSRAGGSSAAAEKCAPCEDERKLLFAALALRFAWALASHKLWGYHEDGAYDDGVYLSMSRQLLSQGIWPLTHPPGYPLVLAPFLKFGMTGLSVARWIQIGISAFIAPLIYRLALHLRQSRAAALIAGAFVVLHPMMIFFSVRIMSETVFTALVVTFFLAWERAWRTGRLSAAALAGFFGGAATLTRGVIMPYGGVLALVALWRRREQPRWAALVAVCGLCWGGTVAPWTAHNWIAYHRFLPVSLQGGWNMYEGQTTDHEEALYKRPTAMGEEVRALGMTDPFAIDDYFAVKGEAWIKANPQKFLHICAVKAVRFWKLAPEPPHVLASRVSAGLFAVVLFAAALLGLRRAAAASGMWFLLAWVLYLNLLHSVYVNTLRYRMPAEPVFALLAGVGAASALALNSLE